MRSRVIKPSLFENEDLATLGPTPSEPTSACYQILFEGLLCLADRNGVGELRPSKIRAKIFPYRPSLAVAAMIQKLANKFLDCFKDEDGQCYYRVKSWTKHGKPHPKEPASFPGKGTPLSSEDWSRLGAVTKHGDEPSKETASCQAFPSSSFSSSSCSSPSLPSSPSFPALPTISLSCGDRPFLEERSPKERRKAATFVENLGRKENLKQDSPPPPKPPDPAKASAPHVAPEELVRLAPRWALRKRLSERWFSLKAGWIRTYPEQDVLATVRRAYQETEEKGEFIENPVGMIEVVLREEHAKWIKREIAAKSRAEVDEQMQKVRAQWAKERVAGSDVSIADLLRNVQQTPTQPQQVN